MEDTLVDIFDSVEVITDEEVDNTSDTGIISIDEIFKNNSVNEEKVAPAVEEPKQIITKKRDKVLLIQIGLLIAWIIITVLIYFYGYDLFEPFIKVSQK